MATAKAHIRPRPLRVAYFVEETELWRKILDEIFAECYGRWGGRFSLIVPCENGDIRPAYGPWLEAYDPDIIYSYANLSDAAVVRLNEALCPAFLVKHHIYGPIEQHPHAYLPRLPVSPLTVLSVAAVLTRGDPFFGFTPVSLVDTHIGTQPSQFLQHNFGCYNRSLRPWPMGRNMAPYFKPVIYVPDEVQKDTRIVPRAEGELVSTEQDLIARLGSQRNLRGCAQLSAALTPRLELDANVNWSRTVNLVVGDSFIDWLAFWNGIHYTPVWLDGSVITLKVSAEDIADDVRFQSISEIIKNRIHLPLDNNASHSQIVLRSASLPNVELEQLVSRFKEANRFNHYTSEVLTSPDSPVPSPRALEHAQPNVEAGSLFQGPDWHEQVFSGDVFRPTTILPRHIRDTPQMPPATKAGLWALDLDIERQVDHSRFQNVQHRWRLPRRLRFVGAFTRGYQLTRMSPWCMPRCTLDGLLSLTCGSEGRLPEITAPTDEIAFHHALCNPLPWWPFEHGKKLQMPRIALDMRPSDKGRYLTALLRMSGGIHRAEEIFLSSFWKEQFELLGATPKAAPERVATVNQRLRRRFRGGQIASDDEWERLARVVIAEARLERLPPRYIRFDRLNERYREIVNQYREAHPEFKLDDDWVKTEMASLPQSVRYLCERQILHQGHEWRCRQCYNNNWIGIDELGRVMTCGVCGATRSAPVDEPWSFKLNGFVVEGLREHGLLPVIWCLAKCVENSQASFFYLESQELFYTEESVSSEKSDAELDLLIVSDGAVRLCEVKSPGQVIDIEKLARLTNTIRPNVVTVAAMEPNSSQVAKRVNELRQHIGADIHVELMTFDYGDGAEGTTLPTGTAEWVRLF